MRNAISPTRVEDYPEWYQQVIKAADLAENSEVRGCMVIKPWGYSLWENIQRCLDKMFRDTGHRNAYFPLFIPLSYMEKEAEHVEGFAKECAVVTHHRLEPGENGGLVPAGPLQEPLIIRPTSETIIGAAFSRWVQSYRDLPLLINQWANVVRWELRTRLFLRTAEFLWQEGHTVHATEQEAVDETLQMLDVYADFCENFMAVPVIKGRKTASERFPGAVETYCIEAMMQDQKALQAGTSHFLGQNFSRASNIKFQDENSQESFAWTTSWGVSTRLVGALIMAHGDDDGLVMPPRIAASHIAIIPMLNKEEIKDQVLEYCDDLVAKLKEINYYGTNIRVEYDKRDTSSGQRTWEWIKKGVPIRIEVGGRELEEGNVFMGRRDKGPKDKKAMAKDEFVASVTDILDDIHNNLFTRAKKFRKENTKKIDDKDEFYKFFTPENKKKPEIHGGFALCHWSGDADVEEQVKKDLKVTIRCIPLDDDGEEGKCIISGKPSKQRVIFGKAY
ncbi:proline--tRNA ligase [Candidatus Uabimicrobium amorphum]|uniref:Proline--tRNA ligase n=2 Tax=Uabimicrobium amorphum TaxID=2596890 RepID=A0A5S9F4Z5_UABAM|nr:proline--tRNA ligase [Candidatus Uabimicrobium amorphum]BBM86078.1 proline--tRNA ligase [Candidatus Uabimicrobium amorphum]